MTDFDSLPQPFPIDILRAREAELATKIASGDEPALNELVLRNMREAILYTRHVSRNVDSGQLMSLCYEALIRNAKRFDPTRQRFFAFAKAGLRGAIYRSYNKERARETTELAHLRDPSLDSRRRGPKSPARRDVDTRGRETIMYDYDFTHESQITEPDFESVFTRDRWAIVKPVIDQKCSGQETMVLTLSYVSGLNFQEVGDLLGVTRSAIQRTHWRAIKKLRTELGRRKQLFT